MRFVERLCSPAFLYLVFVALSVGLDVSFGNLGVAAVKSVIGVAIVMILDSFCSVNLGVVSWFLVATPFVITALATAISIGTQYDVKIKEKFSLTPSSLNDPAANPHGPADDLPESPDALYK